MCAGLQALKIRDIAKANFVIPRSMENAAAPTQKGKTWFITGASSGFGRLLAEHVYKLGGSVVATARDVDDIRQMTTDYAGMIVLSLDVTNPNSVARATADALGYVDHIDVLVNNAGYGTCGAIEEMQANEYMPMFNTNFFGLVDVTQSLLSHFRERRAGAIINMSSIGGLIGNAGWGFYNATKFALEGFTEALAAEMAPFNVKVMAVEPGPFRTDFLHDSNSGTELILPDYRPTVGKVREYFKTQDGKQPGDPQRAVEAIVQAISAPEPPRHLLLGKLALQRFRDHLTQWNKGLDRWEDVSNGADFPDRERSLTATPYQDVPLR